MEAPDASQNGINCVYGIIGVLVVTALALTIGLVRANAFYQEATQRKTDERYWIRGSLGMDPFELTSAPGIERGQEIYRKVCVACHGQNGEGQELLRAPAIHQQEDWYLRAQMKKFREGVRGSHPEDTHGNQMRTMMAGLPDMNAYADLAAFIISLDAPPAPTKVQGDLVLGKEIFDTTCAECHGKNGEGNLKKNAPALRGQNDWYLVVQLGKFRSGVRGGHWRDLTGAEMAVKAKSLTTEQSINDVAAYIASLAH